MDRGRFGGRGSRGGRGGRGGRGRGTAPNAGEGRIITRFKEENSVSY